MKKLTFVLLVLVGLGNIARAGHDELPGSVGFLLGETEELEMAVRYAPLNYNVQASVARFSMDVRRLADCTGLNSGMVGVHPACQFQLGIAQNSFRLVGRYLYDTFYQFPDVCQRYLAVQQALSALSMPGPGPIPGPGPFPGPGPGPHPGPFPGPQPHGVRCTAVDARWEEHFGGHTAFGRNIQEAQWNALRQCQQFHSRCRITRCQ